MARTWLLSDSLERDRRLAVAGSGGWLGCFREGLTRRKLWEEVRGLEHLARFADVVDSRDFNETTLLGVQYGLEQRRALLESFWAMQRRAPGRIAAVGCSGVEAAEGGVEMAERTKSLIAAIVSQKINGLYCFSSFLILPLSY